MRDWTSSNKLKLHPVLENNDKTLAILCAWQENCLLLNFLATSNSIDTSIEPNGGSFGPSTKSSVDSG
jgi:hypothetical protein